MAEKLLDAQDVSVEFKIAGEYQKALHKVNLSINHGEVLALVGESGSGKSTFAMSVMGLHNPDQTKVTGSIKLNGNELIGLTERQFDQYRGVSVGMIFQDPLSSLNPLMKIGDQIAEAMTVHDKHTQQVSNRVLGLLDDVGIVDAKRVAQQYPHALSGGMRQRVMIAIALANEPDLIIADEPTTALDVTIQAQILDLIKEIQQKKNAGILLITHDLGVVAEMADTVAVMYAGQIVEKAGVEELFNHPKHPYTRSLLRADPSDVKPGETLYAIPGTVPALKDMDHNKDLFLQRVPWLDESVVNANVKDELQQVGDHHYVRGTAWQNFEFNDVTEGENQV
ncbi:MULTISPECIES: ABC transporter ATP-binding protein [Leuconostoc]|jgi:peptide/nickel transport system ATP-binding protein|uniref:ABC transporter ATP-binding protein n=2 Tax=Leuconostoc TaxID=1243 RepID=A0A5B8T3C0_LEUPS|nr:MULTISPECIES: ABC transporter ATP-binding protein [Leuconostoc]MBK0040374.1 ABC transporter ATP-binding protein [Leuconostoc sp. S51]MBK0051280.1 ABC transporter ATP-binding protein [Leuconostoc sp. S50]MBS0958419.1 ABC transporter ATP-binding protein [Leuconostoc pseudomesenteroides]MCC8440451.1 ABC transporter ATP-binding protein [Leuconostoc pseudomesenteroides]MCT4381614.1 ABC transporter ATP-binding protein [Leuconostoc pseudomesenteroides]